MKIQGANTCAVGWKPDPANGPTAYAMTFSGCGPGSVYYRGSGWMGGCDTENTYSCGDDYGTAVPTGLEYMYIPAGAYGPEVGAWLQGGELPSYGTLVSSSAGLSVAPLSAVGEDVGLGVVASGALLFAVLVAARFVWFLGSYTARLLGASTGRLAR